jgi:hypothetical protein
MLTVNLFLELIVSPRPIREVASRFFLEAGGVHGLTSSFAYFWPKDFFLQVFLS